MLTARVMNKVSSILPVLAVIVAAPVSAQGQLTTVERGHYVCELPGDAAGAVGIPQPEESFTIESASRYVSPQGDGLTMTSGPRNGDTYEVVGRGFLRKIENGAPSRLRCVRQGR